MRNDFSTADSRPSSPTLDKKKMITYYEQDDKQNHSTC